MYHSQLQLNVCLHTAGHQEPVHLVPVVLLVRLPMRCSEGDERVVPVPVLRPAQLVLAAVRCLVELGEEQGVGLLDGVGALPAVLVQPVHLLLPHPV